MKLLACLVVTVAILVLFCLAVVHASQSQPFVQTHSVHLASGFAALGLLLCLLSKSSDSAAAEETKRRVWRFLGRPNYWGRMFILFGGIVASQQYFPPLLSHPSLKGHLASVDKILKSSLSKVGVKAKAAARPALKLQGIFYRRPP